MSTYCANEDCRWAKERKGGVFHYRDGKWYCDDCVHMRYQLNPGKNLYEFETLNISNKPGEKPIRVQGLSHLRKLEQQYGVVSVAANYDSKRFEAPPRSEIAPRKYVFPDTRR